MLRLSLQQALPKLAVASTLYLRGHTGLCSRYSRNHLDWEEKGVYPSDPLEELLRPQENFRAVRHGALVLHPSPNPHKVHSLVLTTQKSRFSTTRHDCTLKIQTPQTTCTVPGVVTSAAHLMESECPVALCILGFLLSEVAQGFSA